MPTLLLTGCASGPSGSSASNQSPNRLAVKLTTQDTLNQNYYYAVAFDDVAGDGQGPVAIVGTTPVFNGIVGGSWRVCVIWHAGAFSVFRRGTPNDATTEVERTTDRPFIGTPFAGSNTINFTLDLDATFGSANTFYFPHGTDGKLSASNFEINFVTADSIIANGDTSGRTKPVDAYEDTQTATFFQFQVDATRTLRVPDVQGDRNPGSTSTAPSFNFGQIDVRSLDLTVTRG